MLFRDLFPLVASDKSVKNEFKQMVYEFIRDIIYEKNQIFFMKQVKDVDIYFKNQEYIHSRMLVHWSKVNVEKYSEYLHNLVHPPSAQTIAPAPKVFHGVHPSDTTGPTPEAQPLMSATLKDAILRDIAMLIYSNLGPSFEFTCQKENKKVYIKVTDS